MQKHYSRPSLLLLSCLPLLASAASPALPANHPHRHAVPAADWQLTGRVTTLGGEGLPGVTVLVKGTTIGASTDADGRFTLNVPERAGTLVFSSIGYQSQEKTYTGPATFTVKLGDDTKSLDDVVVVGYGTQKRADVTSAISTFEAGKQLETRPLSRVDQALVGQLAGVQVQQTSGVPGRAFSVQVRGTASITAGNEPLYVIDGFPLDNVGANGAGRFGSGNPLDNINPNDIENIEVLKDAAAAAIYGSRAANGVVLITTRRGKIGKAVITVSSNVGISRAAKKLDLLSAEEWTQKASEYINNNWVKSGAGRTASQTTAERQRILGVTTINPALMIDERWNQPGHPGLKYIDWQNEAFRTGITQTHQLSAAGGSDNVNYYVSANYNDQQGIFVGLGYKRYSARANVEVKASDKLRFGLNITPTYAVTTDPNVEGKDNRLHQIVAMTPVAEDTAGVATGYGKNDPYRWGLSTASPLLVAQNAISESRSFRTLSTAYAEVLPFAGLRLRSSINFDNNDTENKNYQPPTRLLATSLATGSYSSFRRQTFVNENTATYDRVLGKHSFTLLAGQSYNFSKLYTTALAASGGFINNTVTTLNGATAITGTSTNFTTETQSVLLSYFGRLNYSYDSKYLLSASVRADGSSRFGSDNQWGTFPAVSLGWRISQESFLKGAESWLTDLKLRASLGYAGNNTIGDYSSIATLGFYNYTLGGATGVQVTGQAPNRVNNPQLRWEKNRTFDVGLDLALFSSRIYLSADYYTKNSRDLLLNVLVPTASGFSTNLVNIGEVQNKGLEFALTTRNVQNGNFTWTTNANLAYNENQVLHLGPGDATIEVPANTDTPHTVLQVGQPLYAIYVVKQDGILSQADIDARVPLYGNQTAGDPRYVDANGDGKIDSNDRQVVGQPNPKFTWGITNTFSFKGFDLSFLVQGQNGGSIYSLLGRAIDRTSVGYQENALGRVRDRWYSADNPGNGVEGKTTANFGFIKNTNWLYSNDYYRVRFITLGYDLARLTNRKVAQSLRVYVTAENFFGHDNYYGGFNPDAVNTANNTTYASGIDYGGLPLSKSLIFGANITF